MYRYVASELATDITITVGDVKFYLHKVCISFRSGKILIYGLSIVFECGVLARMHCIIPYMSSKLMPFVIVILEFHLISGI